MYILKLRNEMTRTGTTPRTINLEKARIKIFLYKAAKKIEVVKLKPSRYRIGSGRYSLCVTKDGRRGGSGSNSN